MVFGGRLEMTPDVAFDTSKLSKKKKSNKKLMEEINSHRYVIIDKATASAPDGVVC